MLSRASSNSRLRRSKSSASVKTRRQPPPVPEPLDPQAARLHALTAASLAMGRRPQHSSEDSEGSFTQSRQSNVEPPSYPRRRNSTRTTETGNSVTTHSLATSRSQTPLRNAPTREGSLEPVPEQPFSTGDFTFVDDVNVPSEPSSYRRVRKSKSLFGALLRDGNQNSPRRNDSIPPVPVERLSRKTLRRSLSFFTGKDEAAPGGITHSDNSDAAVRLAREQFLQGLAQQRRLEASEPASDKRNKREQRPFRKSFRSTSSSNSHVGGNPANGRGGPSKSQSFSTSVKNGFRRLFGRSSASQNGKSFAIMAPSPLRTSRPESPPSNSPTVVDSNQTPRQPSRHRAQPMLEQRPTSIANRPASLRTVKSSASVCSSTASVSSWADSMATNTMASRHGGTDPAQQLDAIREDSGYQATQRAPSARSYRKGYPRGDLTKEFDSQRVYSALMRQINRTNAEKCKEGDMTPKQTKTQNPDAPTPGTVRSIRTVPNYPSAADSTSSVTALGKLPAGARQYQSSRLSLTPQQVAHCNEGTERHHRQQSSPYASHSARVREPSVPPGTPTPFGHRPTSHRQALDAEDDSGTIIVNRSAQNTAICQSPSVYSRTASGASFHTDGCGSNQSDSEDDRGTATILASHRVEYSPTRKSGGRNCEGAIKGSAEWKQWMSSQLDIINSSPVAANFPGHYREQPQITDDDGFQLETCVGGRPSESRDDSPAELEDTETSGPPLVELPALSQSSNFSRPLRHSPSGPISLRDTPVRKPSVTAADHSPSLTAIMTNAETRVGSSKGSSQSRSPSKTPNLSPLVNHNTVSPGQVTTPTRYSQRSRNTSILRGRLNQYRTSPSAPNRTREENPGLAKENQNLHENTNANSPPLRKHTENELAKLENIHSTIGSKRMVDTFLSDRRRAMETEEDEEEIMSAEPAFL